MESDIKSIEKKLRKVEKITGIIFSNPSLLLEALTHPSYYHENPNIGVNNQRLEFLGDSVIGLVISEVLYKTYQDANEGLLSQIKNYLVKKDTLAKKAKRLGLNNFILLGKGEELQQGREKDSILADLFEAYIGALFLDKGFEFVKKFIINIYKEDLEKLEYEVDWKTLLKRLLLSINKKPVYKLVKEEGPQHKKRFFIELWIDNEKISEGEGSSKKQAEIQAAQRAFEKLKENVS
ncbi:MAG: ribonuclease III [Dictyoglomaceae bacterium]|nr:ribonuclease III [Dictyoglomaceae bacterium]